MTDARAHAWSAYATHDARSPPPFVVRKIANNDTTTTTIVDMVGWRLEEEDRGLNQESDSYPESQECYTIKKLITEFEYVKNYVYVGTTRTWRGMATRRISPAVLILSLSIVTISISILFFVPPSLLLLIIIIIILLFPFPIPDLHGILLNLVFHFCNKKSNKLNPTTNQSKIEAI